MNNALVAYFSAGGVTARAAELLARQAGAELYEIRPAQPYTAADLDWTNKRSRSSVEMNDRSFRPPLADQDAPVGECGIVFLGFPIWWGVAPTVVNTFLESYDFTGKTIVLFATSGGSGMGRTAEELAPSCPGAKVVNGGLISGGRIPAALGKWLENP